MSREIKHHVLLIPNLVEVSANSYIPSTDYLYARSAATSGSPYYRYAERYQATFERNGVKLEIRKSGGSLANACRWRFPSGWI